MKITKIEMIPVTTPLKRPFVMRATTITGIDSVLFKLHTDEGLVGISESGDTSSWYRGETQESMMAMVARFFARDILLGEDPRKIEKIVGRMDIMARDNNQAKYMVDAALHDLLGKIFNVPLYQLLGGRTIERVPLGLVLGAGSPAQCVPEALAVLKEGYRFVKLKTGHGTLKDDIEMVAAVREAVGDDVDLFIDVNGAWTYDQALYTLRALEKYNLSRVEQPLPHWDIEGLARLRGQIGTPVYADESAQELHNLYDIIQKRAADGLMIKLQKAGGILKAQRWLTMARLANLPVICGCMVSTGLEASPAAHLLVADEWVSRFPQENAGPLHTHDVLNTVSQPLPMDMALNVPRYEGGYLYPNEGPGLGIDLNEELIPRIRTPGKEPVVLQL